MRKQQTQLTWRKKDKNYEESEVLVWKERKSEREIKTQMNKNTIHYQPCPV